MAENTKDINAARMVELRNKWKRNYEQLSIQIHFCNDHNLHLEASALTMVRGEVESMRFQFENLLDQLQIKY